MSVLALELVSDLIAAIYDCAIDPDRWPGVMRRLAGAIRCMDGALLVYDRTTSRCDLFKAWNCDPRWADHVDRGVIQSYQRTAPLLAQPIDEPIAIARVKPAAHARVHADPALPLGVCDGIITIVLREPERLGIFAANRHESIGPISDDDLAVMRVFAPHIRRAVAIGDAMDIQASKARALASIRQGLVRLQ